MKKILAILVLTSAYLTSYSQFQHSLELGGSNYTGLSFATAYEFHLPQSSVYIAPKIGVGHIFGWDRGMTVQGGLGIGYQLSEKTDLEFASNVSQIVPSPFVGRPADGYQPYPHGNGNLLWYNGVDYIRKWGKLKYSFGAGVLMHFGQNYQGSSRYYFSGDPIPMAKIGIRF